MRIAAVQMDVTLGDPGSNLGKIAGHLRDLKQAGVDLAVFPEAALTGYCVDNAEQAKSIAIDSDGPWLTSLRAECDRLNMMAVAGYAESSGHHLYNTAALFEAGCEPRYYRKTHLPELGLDKFVDSGDQLPVWETRFGRIGILICFDLRFPEASRTLAMEGADLLILPTNWPEGAETSAEFISVARAAENKVFVVTCNRVGTENGFLFIGRSKIVHPSGKVLEAAGSGETILIADIDLAEARRKRTVVIPGKYETETFAARRPELYRCQ